MASNAAEHTALALRDLAPEDALVLIFNSIHRVLKAEKLFKGVLPFKMQPTPRPLVSECGLSIRLHGADFTQALGILEENRVKVVHVFREESDGFSPVDFS